MYQKHFAVPVVLVCVVLLGACTRTRREYFSKSSYFDGGVIVEYKQSRARGSDDYLTFRFYEKGTYQVIFSITPGKGVWGQDNIPQNFTCIIHRAPREVLVKQYVLPDFLRVTITKDGETELNDFS